MNHFINIRDFGAIGNGIADDTLAINRADAEACAGRLEAGYVQWEKTVYFPPGRYRVDSTLTYRGAPWVGSSTSTSVIDFRGLGACVDAVGTNNERKHLQISHMKLLGSGARLGAYGLRIGHNQRSFYALSDVRIESFPSYGMLFDEDTWIMGLYEVYLLYNAHGGNGTSAIGIADHVTNVNAIEWYNSVVENNGKAGSRIGGGIEGTSAINQMAFFGGTWEGNQGAAEMRFVGGQSIHLDGMYIECDISKNGVDNGLVFSDCSAKVVGSRIHSVSGHTGTAVIANGTSRVSLDHNHFGRNWPLTRFADDTAEITVVSDASENITAKVSPGSAILRLTPKRVAIADAPLISIDASLGTTFEVSPLRGNRTIGVPTNPSVGQRITIILNQDFTGRRMVTWTAPYYKHVWQDTKNVSGARAVIQFEFDGSRWNQVSAQAGWY